MITRASVKSALEVINEMVDAGVIKDYAVCGGIAALYYAEPVSTYDLDILFEPNESAGLAVLGSVFEFLRSKGYSQFEGEHAIIEGMPVQFIPVHDKLTRDALSSATTSTFEVHTKVIGLEYVIATYVKEFRPKDQLKLHYLFESATIDTAKLKAVLSSLGLWDKFKTRVLPLLEEEERRKESETDETTQKLVKSKETFRKLQSQKSTGNKLAILERLQQLIGQLKL